MSKLFYTLICFLMIFNASRPEIPEITEVLSESKTQEKQNQDGKAKENEKKQYQHNEIQFLNFSFHLPTYWRFQIDDLNKIIKYQDKLNLHVKNLEHVNFLKIEFESYNKLAYGKLNLYRNIASDNNKSSIDIFKQYLSQKLVIDKIAWIKQIGEGEDVAYISKSFISNKDQYDLSRKEIYLAMYFSKNHIYEIVIIATLNGLYDFDNYAVDIFSRFKIYRDNTFYTTINLTNQGVKINYQNSWELLDLDNKQILNLRHLKYPFFFDLEFIDKISSKKSHREIYELDVYRFFNYIALSSPKYDFIKKVTQKRLFKLPYLNLNYPDVYYYIFSLDDSVQLKSQSKIQLYYFVANDNLYRARLWYNQYHVDYEKVLGSILENLEFLN